MVTRTVGEAVEAVETYSPAEERFNRRRRTAGLFAGPAVFLLVLLWPMPGLPAATHRLAAVLATVVVLWITEALPMPITAIAGPALAILLGVAPARTALAPFADPIIFLFIGSFMLAEAMFVHGVDRRIAYTALSWRMVGTSPVRVLIVYGGVAAFISMWVSNTATAAMLYPIGLAISVHVARSGLSRDRARAFALSLMLMTSFAASIGGIATPVGTPPNLIGIALMARVLGVKISFFQWMVLGVPTMAILLVFLIAYFGGRTRGVELRARDLSIVQQELRKLGPVSMGQRNALLAFAVTIALWIMPGVFAVAGLADTAFAKGYTAAVPESVAALIGAILLFVLPVSWRARQFTLSWEEASRIDWGIILLFGGGLAVGELAFSTGLADAMGQGITSWLPLQGTVGLTVLFTGFAIIMSEAASNTAAANMIVPVAIAVARAAGVNPIEPALGATLGSSMGFMMPISTPPNAIVYSSGHVPITAMMRHGIVLDLVAWFVISGMVLLLGPVFFH
ncbi:MAG: DASS family sodium-coupled anion symporter [Acidobacteria bacterium]|nr:DASS family sodium-coupled anion symporter [Acidobacteriota bacterium]